MTGSAQAALVNLDALTIGETYTLTWDGQLAYVGDVLNNGVVEPAGLNVLTFAVSKNGTYLGDVQTVCIDLNMELTSPFEYVLRKGYDGVSTPGMVGSEEDWDALTKMVSDHSAAMSGSAAQRAGLQIAAWELAAGDSVNAYQSDWGSTGVFGISSVAPEVVSAADAFLDSARPGLDWTGGLYWFDGVDEAGQDLLTGVPEVPGWAVMQFGLLGLAWIGAKRRSAHK